MDSYEQVVDLWKSYSIGSTEELDMCLSNFRILFAFHSGRIENEDITYHDTREIFENGKVSNFSGDPRALFEQQNQKLGYEFLKAKLISKEPLSIYLVKEIHKILTSGTYDERRFIINEERPGEFKKYDYVTGINEVGSAVENVESDLIRLLEEVNNYQGTETLKVASYFHARFEFIHPFADGNGRVGRTLLNYYLMINEHPPLIVHNEDKAEYYHCLQIYDEAEDIAPLHDFLRAATEKTWENTLALANGMIRERRKLDDYSVQCVECRLKG